MNERIRELAKNCGYQHKPITSLGEVDDFKYFDLERFAESIIQECINVLHDNELWSRDVSHVLKEHFGVEL